MKKKRKQNRSKSNRNRYYFELNNQPYGYSGLVPVENGDFQNWVDSGKSNMEERGYETDLETTEKYPKIRKKCLKLDSPRGRWATPRGRVTFPVRGAWPRGGLNRSS